MDLHIHIANLHLNLPDGSPVLDLLTRIKTQGETIMAVLDGLTASVAKEIEVEKSAIALIVGLSEKIKAAGTDPVALKALTDQMDSSSAALAAAIAANTPAAPAPVVDPPLVP